MNPESSLTRTCRTCGARVPTDQPCAACALSQVLFEDAFPESPALEIGVPNTDGAAQIDTGFDATTLPCALGPYIVRREIALGGSGVVYEAEDTRTRRLVALKLFRSLLLVGESDKARFKLEAETAARLDHPNIVPVYEVGEHRRQPFISMKLMEGGSLAQRITSTLPRISDRDAAGLVSTIARAVQHAHQHGVLHRDLKPGNVLFDAKGKPYLSDFGLAKLVNEDSSLTLSSAHLGTPHYMSPEQAAGRVRDISTASDLWALGTILYQLTTGLLPFAGESQEEIFRKIIDTDPVPPAQARALSASKRGDRSSAISDSSRSAYRDLETLCLRCLEKDPARRPASAGELADELDRWLRGEPIQSRPVTPLERAGKWVLRNKKISLLSASLLLALITGVVFSTAFWRRAEAARRYADGNALRARAAETNALDHAYFATVAQAFSSRQQGNLGHARELLASLDPSRRGFEWRLLQWFCRGDDVTSLNLHPELPRCIAWEPVRKRLAVLMSDRVLRWVDPQSGTTTPGPTVPDPRAKHTDVALDDGFHTLAFSPDGRHFLCGDGDILIIANSESGELIYSTACRRMGGLWIDNERVLFAGNNLWGATYTAPSGIYNLTTRSVERKLEDIFGPMAITPDRNWVVWSRDHPLGMEMEVLPLTNLLAVATRQQPPAEKLLLTNWSPALCTLSPDRRYLAVVTGRQARSATDLTIFDTSIHRTVFDAPLSSQAHSIAFAPKDPVVAVASSDTSLRTFRVGMTNSGPVSYDDDTSPGLSQPAGEAGPQTPPLELLSRTAGKGRYGFLLGHTERIRDLAFLPGSPSLATVSDDGTLRTWPVSAPAPASRIGGISTFNTWEHPSASSDGRFTLYRILALRAELWDRNSNRTLRYPERHFPLAMLKDGRSITRDSDTGEIFIWSSIDAGVAGDGPKELWRIQGTRSFPGFGQGIRGAISADERIVVGLIPGKLIVLNLETRTTSGTDDQRMLYGASGVNCIDLSPDGRWIAVTGFIGRRARLYRTDAVNEGFFPLGQAEDYDTAIAFHPDGKRLFVGNEDGWVRVFDVATRQELPTEAWRAQTGAVTALAVSQDGRIVATSGDQTLHFWNAVSPGGEPRQLRLRIGPIAPRNWIRFANDDRVLLHCAPKHALEAWEAPAIAQ